MAWDWVAPASSALIGLAGLAGGVTIAVTGRRHERHNAHEQWYRDRRAEAYLDLLDMAEGVGQWIEMVHPLMDPRPVPDLPSLESQRRVRARIAAYGSRAVKDRMRAWDTVGFAALRAAEGISRGDDNARLDLHERRGKEKEAREALADEIANELGVPGQA